MKPSPKIRTIIFLSTALLVLLASYLLFFKNANVELKHTVALTPFTKAEQQALIVQQEQEDEKGIVGPLTPNVDTKTAENRVLNLRPAVVNKPAP